MGERYCYVVIGATLEDMPECPDENGWPEWAWNRPELRDAEGRGYPRLEGCQLRSSYESEPSWIGFQVRCMEYGEVLTLLGSKTESLAALRSWKAFQGLVLADLGLRLPMGKIIVAVDG